MIYNMDNFELEYKIVIVNKKQDILRSIQMF